MVGKGIGIRGKGKKKRGRKREKEIEREALPHERFLPERDYVRYVRVFPIANPSVVCNFCALYSGN